jgi:hypothetical protein
MTAKQPFRERILYSNIFCFLLILLCVSTILYATDDNYSVKVLAIGIHYQGQPDATWVVKEVANSPDYAIIAGHIQPALEVGIASDLSAGVVDKIALKWIWTPEGGASETGWERGYDIIDQPTPPSDAYNLLALPGGPIITLEDNSNKKVVLQFGSSGPPSAVVISDM